MTSVIEKLAPSIEALDTLPINVWPLWVIGIQERIQEYAMEEGEFEETIKQLHSILEQKVAHYIRKSTYTDATRLIRMLRESNLQINPRKKGD